MSFQSALFQVLQEKLPAHSSSAKWLAAQLDIDYSAAHRKISGKSHLKPDEMAQLFQLCPELVTALPQPATGQHLVVRHSSFRDYTGLERYLTGVRDQLQQALEEDMRLDYFARDLPFFFFLAQPELAAYKFAMWTQQLKEGMVPPLSPEIGNLCEDIFALYGALPSKEIWYSGALDSQLDQLQWHYEVKVLDAGQYQQLLEAYLGTLRHFKNAGKKGHKEEGGTYELYGSGFCTLNNGGIFKNAEKSRLLQAVMSVFFIQTEQSEMVEVFEHEYEAHLQRALNLHNRKWAQRFFSKQEKRIKATIADLKKA